MAVKPARPKWQTTVLFFAGLSGIGFEAGLNAITGQQVNYALVGAFMGMMGLGPVLSSTRRKDSNGNDDAL